MKIIVYATADHASMAAGCAAWASTHGSEMIEGEFKLIEKGPYLFSVRRNKGSYTVWDNTPEKESTS